MPFNSDMSFGDTSTLTKQYPLDLLAPSAMSFSLRKLRAGYTGNCIQVRRSSDNTTLNIGFGTNGILDTAALLTFAGVGDAFVTTWYDQSGNGRNLTTATNANQPKIVAAGALNVMPSGGPASTFPAMLFDGVDDYLSRNEAFLYAAGQASSYFVFQGNVVTDQRLACEGSSTTNNTIYSMIQAGNTGSGNKQSAAFVRNDVNASQISAGVVGQNVVFEGTATVAIATDSGSQIKHYKNNEEIHRISYTRSGALTPDRFAVGAILRAAASNYFSGNMSEAIFFTRVLSTRGIRLLAEAGRAFFIPSISQFVNDVAANSIIGYGLRRMYSTYNGPCIRVRRSSDNAEQNFGFGEDGWLNTAAVEAYCGTGDGFVTVWYDQSGTPTRDAVQATQSKQPRIVQGGKIETANGKPTVRFLGVGYRLSTSDFTAFASGFTVSCVAKANARVTANDFPTLVSKTGASGTVAGPFQIWSFQNKMSLYTGNGAGTEAFTQTRCAFYDPLPLSSHQYGSDTTTRYSRMHGLYNGQGTAATYVDSGSALHIGGRGDDVTGSDQCISEVVIHPTWIGVTLCNRIYRNQKAAFNLPTPEVIDCLGDSLTDGFPGTRDNAYPTILQNALHAARPNKLFYVINDGVSGNTIGQMRSRAQANIFLPYITADAGVRVLQVVFGGTNDLYTNITPANTYLALRNLLTDARDSSYITAEMVLTLPPRSDASPQGATPTNIANYNQLIRDGFGGGAGELVGLNVVSVIDVTKFYPFESPQRSPFNLIYYSTDRLHLADGGYGADGLAGIVFNEIMRKWIA